MAHLLGRFRAMPDGALQLGLVSALSAVQYAGVRRAVRAHVIEAVIRLSEDRNRLVGGSELRVKAIKQRD